MHGMILDGCKSKSSLIKDGPVFKLLSRIMPPMWARDTYLNQSLKILVTEAWVVSGSALSLQFRREEDAEKAVIDLNNRWFNGQPIHAELSPVTDFREACCRQYEMG